MSSDLGLLEIDCDAPPYPIVRACRKLGMTAPEDVRWCRTSHLGKRHHGWISSLASRTLGRWLGRHQPENSACTCGHPLPCLESYSFLFHGGDQADYTLGQCPRCQTIYWEKG
jgi:hypothetical protein